MVQNVFVAFSSQNITTVHPKRTYSTHNNTDGTATSNWAWMSKRNRAIFNWTQDKITYSTNVEANDRKKKNQQPKTKKMFNISTDTHVVCLNDYTTVNRQFSSYYRSLSAYEWDTNKQVFAIIKQHKIQCYNDLERFKLRKFLVYETS